MPAKSVVTWWSFASRWVRGPVLPVALLAAAVAVSVAKGQPPPADRASGVSIPARNASVTPPGIGTLLLVTDGTLTRYDVATGTRTPVALPASEEVLQAWPMRDADVTLTVRTAAADGPPTVPGAGSTTAGDPDLAIPEGTAAPGPRLPDPDADPAQPAGPDVSGAAGGEPTFAYAIPHGGRPVSLGAASAVVPAFDGTHVWLLRGDTAWLVALDGRATGTWVRVPPGYHLVASTADGPVATVRRPAGMTVVLPADGALPRWVANSEALDLAGETLLVHDDHRVGWVDLTTGRRRWLPGLSAVEITGPGTLSPDRTMFAVRARVNDHARLVVGPLDARSGGQLRVVALGGGTALDRPPPPVWTGDGQVLAVRPDGRTVSYVPGDAQGAILDTRFTADGLAAVPVGRRPR